MSGIYENLEPGDFERAMREEQAIAAAPRVQTIKFYQYNAIDDLLKTGSLEIKGKVAAKSRSDYQPTMSCQAHHDTGAGDHCGAHCFENESMVRTQEAARNLTYNSLKQQTDSLKANLVLIVTENCFYNFDGSKTANAVAEGIACVYTPRTH